MDNKQIEMKAENFLIGLLISLILPFLILFLYINPAPEDFFYANEAKLHNFWIDLRIQYRYTTGRYFQIFLLYLTPLNENPFNVYKAVCFLLMLLFYYVIFLSVKLISRNILTLKENILISLTILFLYLYAMPSVSAGFYWYGGLTAYHIGIILIPIFFLFFMRFEKAKKITSIISSFMISSLLIIAIEGSNEILAILFFIFIMLLVIKTFVIEKNYKWSYIVFAAIAAISFYILVKSPANSRRASLFPGSQDFMYSFVNSFTFLGDKIFTWVFYTPLLACTLFLIPVFSNIIKKKEIYSGQYTVNPVWTLLPWFGILYISTFISLYSAILILDRTLNIIYLFFLAGWFLNVFIVYNFIQKKYKISFEKHLKYLYVISFVLISLYLIKENNIKTAFSDLIGGSAYNLNRQLNERFDKIKQSTSDSCQFDSLINIPKTIFYKDISNNPEHPSCQWYGTYFNKKSITLKKLDSSGWKNH